MLKNYLKIAWRNLIKNKVSSFINIGGLAVGMTVAILIALWIYDELSFDKYHQNYDRIARVVRRETWHGETGEGNSQPLPMGNTLRSSYGDDFKHVVMSTWIGESIISYGDKKFTQKGNYMQPEGPEMLTLKMLKGNRDGLKGLNSILLSETLTKKLFDDADPIDKIVKINNKLDVKVTGVFKDLPNNTEFKDLTFTAPWDLYVSSNEWMKDQQNNWSNNFLQILVQLAPNTDFERVSAKIKDLKLNNAGKEEAVGKPQVFLHPMSKWHLYSKFENGLPVMSEPMKFVWFYGIIGVFVLVLACINFMNLSTARSEKRAREVGIRKAVGSIRQQLIWQFFSESLLVAVFAFVLALILVQLILPWFNQVAGKEISILWTNALFWLTGILFTFITGMLAGSYPALYLSSFNPVKTLKGTFRVGRFAAIPRKALVVLQFTVSIALIIGTIIVYRQIQYTKSRPIGYSGNGLLMLQMTSPDFYGKYDVLRSELKNTGVVAEVAESASPVTGIWSGNGGFDWKGKDPKLEANFGTLSVTHEYGKTIGWQFTDGRDFSREFASDSSGFVINEAAAKLMELENPVGEMVTWKNEWFKSGSYKIIGVVKDMVMESPYKAAYPTVFFLQGYMNWIFIKINPAASAGEALSKIEAVFKKLIPSAPFDYKFANDEYAKKFAAEERIAKLASFFAVLAILISCLGLFGLASFVAEQRIKEIGIRKVLGASVADLWRMLSKDFVLLVIISCFIAVPVAWYFLHGWLEKYEYRTEMAWWIFGLAGAGALIITLLTVSFQSIKAALSNPVKSLRTE